MEFQRLVFVFIFMTLSQSFFENSDFLINFVILFFLILSNYQLNLIKQNYQFNFSPCGYHYSNSCFLTICLALFINSCYFLVAHASFFFVSNSGNRVIYGKEESFCIKVVYEKFYMSLRTCFINLLVVCKQEVYKQL